MIKKQLKIWKNDFLKYYDKLSLMGRIILGAIISGAIAYCLINKVIKPQNAKIKAINAKIQSMDIVTDLNSTMIDLKNNQRKAQLRLDGLTKLIDELKITSGSLEKNQALNNILVVRSMMDKNNLTIVSETLIKPVLTQKTHRSRNNKTIIDTRIKPKFPTHFASEGYTFQILGRFADIKAFFMDAFKAPEIFFINNIQFEHSDQLVTDKNFQQHKAINCKFEVHIPYQTENK